MPKPHHGCLRVGRWRGRIPCLILIAPMLLISSCREKNTFSPPPPSKVTMAKPVQETVTIFNEYPGRAEAIASVDIRPRVTGYLLEVHFEEGEEVEKGAVLFTIDPAPYQAAVDAAKAEVERANVALERARYEVDRMAKLRERNAAAEVEMVDAEASRDRGQADLLAAQAALRSAELNLEYTTIHAPIAGRISESYVDAGNLVGTNDTRAMATMTQWDPIHVNFTVDERFVIEFRRRMAENPELKRREVPVQIILADGSRLPETGVIDYVDNELNTSTGTIGVRAVVANPQGRMLPGMYANARIARLPIEDALLVPIQALQRDMSGDFLLGTDEAGVVERIDVEVGEQVTNARIVTSGLAPDEAFVLKGLQRARPGIKVETETASWNPDLESGPATRPAPEGARDVHSPDDASSADEVK